MVVNDQDHWIPVTDRLPCGRGSIAANHVGPVLGVVHGTYAILWYDTKADVWRSLWTQEDRVTHWRELPTLPENQLAEWNREGKTYTNLPPKEGDTP